MISDWLVVGGEWLVEEWVVRKKCIFGGLMVIRSTKLDIFRTTITTAL